MEEVFQYKLKASLTLEYVPAKAVVLNDEKSAFFFSTLISSMANANGGIIFVGVSSQRKAPKSIEPLHNEELITWLRFVCDVNISPKVPNCIIEKIVVSADNGFVIDESKLRAQEHASTLLYEFLYPYGFNPTVISQIFDSIGTQAGKTFEADEYIALHDRNCLFVERKQTKEQDTILIQKCDTYQLQNGKLHFTAIPHNEFALDKNRMVACVDYEKLIFPLLLRVWRQGDSFVPFGMKGRKKVSDFLIDEKVPLLQKQHVLVLESAGEIVWVVGHRISQLFAVTDVTKTVGKFSLAQK